MSSEASQQGAQSRSLEGNLTAAAQTLQSVAKPLVAFLEAAIPVIITTASKAYRQYSKLPQNALHFLYGFACCFFGGLFPVLFAALQAAEHGGRKQVWEALQVLGREALVIVEENKKDDAADSDADGVADAQQADKAEYVARKIRLVLRKMNPDKIDHALNSMYKVWLSVAAVLSIQFARTVSLSLSISDFLYKPMKHYVAPTIEMAVPDEYDKWVPVLLGWLTKAVGMSIAWYVQAVLSAFSSALKGGQMMADACLSLCLHHEVTLGGLIPQDDKETYVDEVLSYVFAGLGLYIQVSSNFQLSFPLNLLLWPASLAEWYVRWIIPNAPH